MKKFWYSKNEIPSSVNCILGCDRSEIDRIYQFPIQDENKIIKWLKIINKPELILPTDSREQYAYYFICSKHFSSAMFTKLNKLCRAAVPDLELKSRVSGRSLNKQLDYIDSAQGQSSFGMGEAEKDPLAIEDESNDVEMEKDPSVVEIFSMNGIKKPANDSGKENNNLLKSSIERPDLLSSLKSFLSSQGLSTDSDKLPANNNDLDFIEKMMSTSVIEDTNLKESLLPSTPLPPPLPSTSLKSTKNSISKINKMNDSNLDKLITNVLDEPTYIPLLLKSNSNNNFGITPQKGYNLRKSKLINKSEKIKPIINQTTSRPNIEIKPLLNQSLNRNTDTEMFVSNLISNKSSSKITCPSVLQLQQQTIQSFETGISPTTQMIFHHSQSQSSTLLNNVAQEELLRYIKENPQNEEILRIPEHIVVSTVFLKSSNISSNEGLFIPVQNENDDECFQEYFLNDKLKNSSLSNTENNNNKHCRMHTQQTQTNFPLIPETIREILSTLSLDTYDGKYKTMIIKLREILSIYCEDNFVKRKKTVGIDESLFNEKPPITKFITVQPTCHKKVQVKLQRNHKQCQTTMLTTNKDMSTMTDEQSANSNEIDSEEELFMEPPGNDLKIVRLSDEKYECIVCCHVTNKLSKIRNHMQKHEERSSLCYYCGKLCGNRLKLSAHESKCIPKDIRDTQAPKCVTDRNDKLYTISADGTYICDICNAEFKKYQKMRAHRFTHLDKDYVCTLCNRIFKNPYDLRQHRSHVHNNNFFKCKICSKRVLVRLYHDHINAHKSNTIYKCGSCEKTFSNRLRYKKHENLCKKGKVRDMCIFCNCELSSYSKKLKDHFYDEEHIENELKWKSDNNVKAYKCLICYRALYLDFYNYLEHCRTHQRRLTYKRPDYLKELLKSCIRNPDDTNNINNDNLKGNKIIADNQTDDHNLEDDSDESDIEDYFDIDNDEKQENVYKNNSLNNIELNCANNDNGNTVINEKQNNSSQIVDHGDSSFRHEKLQFDFTVGNVQLPDLNVCVNNDTNNLTTIQKNEDYASIEESVMQKNSTVENQINTSNSSRQQNVQNYLDVNEFLTFKNNNYSFYNQSVIQNNNQNDPNDDSMIEDYTHNNYSIEVNQSITYNKTEDEIFQEIIEDETEKMTSSNYEYH